MTTRNASAAQNRAWRTSARGDGAPLPVPDDP